MQYQTNYQSNHYDPNNAGMGEQNPGGLSDDEGQWSDR
jgi:hypothetical protein